MKKRLLAFATILMYSSMTSLKALGAFTGIIDMDLTMPNGKSDIIYFFGTNAQRMDMTSQLDKIPEPLRTTVITRKSTPDEAILINHQAGTFSRVNLQTAVENATFIDFDSDYRIEKAGKAMISGYTCEHIRLFSSTEKIEMWLTRDIGNFETFRLLQSQNPRLSNTILSTRLAEEGIDGFPVKIIQENESGVMTMQIAALQPAPIESTEFDIPPGYNEITDSQQPLNTRQKEHLKDLMEKIKSFDQ